MKEKERVEGGIRRGREGECMRVRGSVRKMVSVGEEGEVERVSPERQ